MTWENLSRVLLLQDYNTRVVLLGTMMLGLAAGIIGPFMLLRKRSLMGDAISHATLPGIGLAFMIMVALGGTGKWLPGLLLGATVTGVLGMLCVTVIREYSRIKADAALGIVLSVFFGVGIAILGLIQKMTTGSAAGLQAFIYGRTASMLASDAWLIGGAALAVAVLCALLFKEFSVLCFDQEFASAQGFPTLRLDMAMMGMVVAVTVIGLQAVGLILVIALLIIPPAAARFWTDRLLPMVIWSAGIGAVSCLLGAGASALVPRLPAGAVIVVGASAVFLVSMIFGPQHGLLVRVTMHFRLSRKIAMQHLLRAVYEGWEEAEGHKHSPVQALLGELESRRSWPRAQFRRLLNRARRQGWVVMPDGAHVRLTASGLLEAKRLVHNHRLWELYLIMYADVATSRVDRGADHVEHILGPELVARLEKRLAEDEGLPANLPPSPHAAGGGAS